MNDAPASVDVNDWVFEQTYTSDPMPVPKPWDGQTEIEWHKYRLDRFLRYETARRNKMLLAQDQQGRPLYVLTSTGKVKRRFELSSSRKKRVKERDGQRCTQCGATGQLEVDHIIRYIDGGGNDISNLRTLCHSCHVKRGGRA